MITVMQRRILGFGLVALMAGPLACGGSSSKPSGSGGAGGDEGTAGTSGAAGSGSGGNKGTAGTGAAGASGGTAGSTGTAGSGGTTGTAGTSGADAAVDKAGGGPDAGAVTAADSGGGAGGNALTGMYSDRVIMPVMSGLWIGKPAMPSEAAGGPFIYLFSGPVTCADISKMTKWLPTIPMGTQILEMIIGSTTVGMNLPTVGAAVGASKGTAEVNYAFGSEIGEHGCKSGTLTLTAYKPGMYVEGTLDVLFPVGSIKGKFHADYCPGGLEF